MTRSEIDVDAQAKIARLQAYIDAGGADFVTHNECPDGQTATRVKVDTPVLAGEDLPYWIDFARFRNKDGEGYLIRTNYEWGGRMYSKVQVLSGAGLELSRSWR